MFTGDDNWTRIKVPAGKRYTWDAKSTYVKNPPYFEGMTMTPPAARATSSGARALAVLGDSVTTDHISPAGNISKTSPAAKYLVEQGVQPVDFNSYGARRGNHEVMMRGTFANIRLRNLLVPGVEGGVTVHLPSSEQTSIYDAAMRYKQEGTPLDHPRRPRVRHRLLARLGRQGHDVAGRARRSSRRASSASTAPTSSAWAWLPLQFLPGQNAQSLGLTGKEVVRDHRPRRRRRRQGSVGHRHAAEGGKPIKFNARVRIDTPKEREYYRHGGILQYVLRQLAAPARAA